MKRLVIIIPGSKTKKIPIIQPLLRRFYALFNVDTGHSNWVNKLKKYLGDYDMDVEIFHWSGGISETFSLNPASKRLARFVDRAKDYNEIVLFGKSLGGVVAERALEDVDFENRTYKLIYVATPHRSSIRRFPSAVDVINIYSDYDRYHNFANRVLYFGMGYKLLDEAWNIDIEGVNHSDFNVNREIVVNGSEINMFDFYANIIL